ncbi:MAG: ribosome silencing factor [Planctomycetes bacterium]|nr:ribosome silencing factor [Planctomycetota bacterium]
MPTYTPRELALHAARLCLDKGGLELRVMALPPGVALFDYVVLVSARSDRQTNAIVSEVHQFCKRHKLGHYPVEGESGWMLVDCLDVVVHCLSVEKREHYQLDSLWKAARDLDYVAELKKLPDPDKALAE